MDPMKENVDQPATDRDALLLILEALDIPYAATVGDEEIRAKILGQRMNHTLAMLSDWLNPPVPGDERHAAWSLDYLRERLAEHPAAGYRTDYAEVVADWKAERAAEAEVVHIASCGFNSRTPWVSPAAGAAPCPCTVTA
jgi:hypothetical protein